VLRLRTLDGLSVSRDGRTVSGALAQPRRLPVLALLARAALGPNMASITLCGRQPPCTVRTTSIFPLASMRSLFATFLVSFCTAALATPVRLDAQQPSACAQPSAFLDLHERFERLIASEDSLNVVFRRNYHLPHLPPDSVLVVTDERICERAARAYYRNYIGPRPLVGVEVLRVGDMYERVELPAVGEPEPFGYEVGEYDAEADA
jgi:hypothetical protein